MINYLVGAYFVILLLALLAAALMSASCVPQFQIKNPGCDPEIHDCD